MNERQSRSPAVVLRELVLAMERLAAKAVTQGAVQGLRVELPTLDEDLALLGKEAAKLVSRVSALDGEFARELTQALTRGALDALAARWEEGGLPLHGLLQRLDVLAQEAAALIASRGREIHERGDRARISAAALVDGASHQLRLATPGLVEDLVALAPSVGDALAVVAERFAAGAVRGAAAQVASTLEAPGEPVQRAASQLSRGVLQALRWPALVAALVTAAGLGVAVTARRR